MGAVDLPRHPLAVIFLYVAILGLPANACQHTKFQLSGSISFGDMRVVPKYKVAAPDFPRRHLADKFLYRTLVRVNAYKCAKFQVPSSISYRNMEGIPKYKVGAADFPRRPLAVKLLYVARIPANACQRTKFQLSSSISFGDMREVLK